MARSPILAICPIFTILPSLIRGQYVACFLGYCIPGYRPQTARRSWLSPFWYNTIVKTHKHPAWRKVEITALVGPQKWVQTMSAEIAQLKVSDLFPRKGAKPQELFNARSFAWSCLAKFQQLDPYNTTQKHMNPNPAPLQISTIIKNIVFRYVKKRWNNGKGKPKQRICEELFLDFRSRSGEAFVMLFATTFMMTSQFMGKGKDQPSDIYGQLADYLQLALTTNSKEAVKLKVFTLMAICGASYTPKKKEAN